MDKGTKLEFGEIVQLSPETCRNKMLAGCLMVVTETDLAFGAQGYVNSLGRDGQLGGKAYYRANWDEMDKTGGLVEWIAEE